MTNKENGLLPCPFCGGDDVIGIWEDGDDYHIECGGCYAQTIKYALHDFKRSPSDMDSIEELASRAWNTRAQPQNVEGDERLQEAFKIADARNDEVKELDFGNVFWACGIFADHIRNNPKKEPSGNVNAELLEALKEARSDMCRLADISVSPRSICIELNISINNIDKAIARAAQKEEV